MPQFDPTFFASQIFWLAIIFTGFYFIVSRMIVPKVGGLIEERAERISDDLNAAERLRREAEETAALRDQALAEARAKADAEMAAMTEAAQEATAEKMAELDTRLAERLDAAMQEVEKARNEALTELPGIAADVAAEAFERLSGQSADRKAVEKAVAANKSSSTGGA